MLASPGRVSRSNCSCGFLAPVLPAHLANRHLRLERQGDAVDHLEVAREVGHRSLVADPLTVDRKGRAVGRVDREVGFVDVDLDRAHPDRDAADDLWHRVGRREDLRRQGVDVQRDPDDDDAVVIGPGEAGVTAARDRAAPLSGPDRYILPTAWNGWEPGPAATLVVPIWLEAGQLGLPARPARLARGSDDGRLRAVGDARADRR